MLVSIIARPTLQNNSKLLVPRALTFTSRTSAAPCSRRCGRYSTILRAFPYAASSRRSRSRIRLSISPSTLSLSQDDGRLVPCPVISLKSSKDERFAQREIAARAGAPRGSDRMTWHLAGVNRFLKDMRLMCFAFEFSQGPDIASPGHCFERQFEHFGL